MWKYYLLCLLLVPAINGSKKSRYHIHFQQFECTGTSVFVSNYSCRIEQPERTRLSMEFNLRADLTNMVVNMVVLLPRPPLNEYIKFVEVEADVCKFLKNRKDNSLMYSIYKAIIASNNINVACPIRKGLNYYRNISILEHLPAFMPETKFIVNLCFFVPNRRNETTICSITKGEIEARPRPKRFS